MFPKLETNSLLNKEKIAANIIQEDHVKDMLSKTRNTSYKPWKSSFCPKNSHSPFGDFPKAFLNPKPSGRAPKPIFEKAQATSYYAGFSDDLGNNKFSSGVRGRSVQSRKYTPPAPYCGAKAPRKIPPTHFRKLYDRGDLPIRIVHKGSLNEIDWVQKINDLEYKMYLPVFFDGLREKMDPYRFLAILGSCDLIEQGQTDKIYDCLAQLIVPIKSRLVADPAALNTRDKDIIAVTLKVIQKLAMKSPKIGENLVPYYRQLLPMLNLFKTANKNLGDIMEYGQRKDLNVGDLITETLQVLEKTGGPDAFINIKYMIPSYESCLQY